MKKMGTKKRKGDAKGERSGKRDKNQIFKKMMKRRKRIDWKDQKGEEKEKRNVDFDRNKITKKVQLKLNNWKDKKDDAKEERNESLQKNLIKMKTIKIQRTQIKNINPAKLTGQEIKNSKNFQMKFIMKKELRLKKSVLIKMKMSSL